YLVNHEGVPLGRTAAGTLELHEDDTGLWYETSALDQRNPKALEICSALERGDVAESSFAFRVIRQSWSPDYMQRTIEEFSLQDGDVSSVTYPANPNTSSGLRAAELVEQLAVADLGELVGAARDRSELTGVIDAARTRLDELLVELRGDRGESPSPTLPLGRRRISLGERPVTAR
ncbi:MAG: HK97 family phage prohead protease, partial [Actinomycetota bacterium]